MTNIPHEEEDNSSDPSMGRPYLGIPFELDPDWVEIPGCVWTPELEHKHMPIRDATPGELADTERKRGSSEDETCPIDPLLANLDFTSEYISPKDKESQFKTYLQAYYDHVKFLEDENKLIYIDWVDED